MNAFIYANNINTSLASAISSSATSLTLAGSANLPASIPAGMALVITLNDQATRQNFEVIYATSISGATLSGLLRGQEGTSAQAWGIGDYAWNGITAGQMRNATQLSAFASALNANGWKQYPDPNSPSGFFIEQWGNLNLSATPGQATTVTFPIPFPNANLNISVTAASSSSTPQHVWIANSHGNTAIFTAYSDTANGGCFWRALGY